MDLAELFQKMMQQYQRAVLSLNCESGYLLDLLILNVVEKS